MSQIKVSVCGGGCKDISVPNTGFITNTDNYQNNSEGMVGIGFFVILLVVFGIITTIFLKKNSKHRVIIRSSGLSLLPRKKMALKMFALAILVVSASFVTFNQLKNQENESYADVVQYGDSLTVSASDVDLSVKIDNGEETAFGYATGEVKVSESTQFGYKLLAYVDDNRLASEHGDYIGSVDSKTPTTLGMNNWGLATEAPLDQNSSVWYGVPTTLNDALILKDTEYMTPENDVTKVYYGVKINNELSCGDYNGASINYVAIANVIPPDVKFEFRGEDTYFDEGKTQTSNMLGYANTCTKSKGYVSNEYRVSQTNNVNTDGSWNGEVTSLADDIVIIPEADKLIVEIKYNLRDDVYLRISNGERVPSYIMPSDAIFLEEGVGVERYLINSDSVRFYASAKDIVVGGDAPNLLSGGLYNYSYYAKVYPVYNNAQIGTTYADLPQVCGWTRVLGEYKDPIVPDGKELFGWGSDYIDIIGDNISINNLQIEMDSVDETIKRYLGIDGLGEALKGRTIGFNANWRSYYDIRYDGNGTTAIKCARSDWDTSPKNVEMLSGVSAKNGGFRLLSKTGNCSEVDYIETNTLSQRIYLDDASPHYLGNYYENVVYDFEREDYSLLGWSTDPNAIEPQYTYDDEFILPDNPEGQSLTLYAVWELEDED